jgi:hypothetical protein
VDARELIVGGLPRRHVVKDGRLRFLDALYRGASGEEALRTLGVMAERKVTPEPRVVHEENRRGGRHLPLDVAAGDERMIAFFPHLPRAKAAAFSGGRGSECESRSSRSTL